MRVAPRGSGLNAWLPVGGAVGKDEEAWPCWRRCIPGPRVKILKDSVIPSTCSLSHGCGLRCEL